MKQINMIETFHTRVPWRDSCELGEPVGDMSLDMSQKT